MIHTISETDRAEKIELTLDLMLHGKKWIDNMTRFSNENHQLTLIGLTSKFGGIVAADHLGGSKDLFIYTGDEWLNDDRIQQFSGDAELITKINKTILNVRKRIGMYTGSEVCISTHDCTAYAFGFGMDSNNDLIWRALYPISDTLYPGVLECQRLSDKLGLPYIGHIRSVQNVTVKDVTRHTLVNLDKLKKKHQVALAKLRLRGD